MLGSFLHLFPPSHHYAKCTELVCQLKAGDSALLVRRLERKSQTLCYSNNVQFSSHGRLVGGCNIDGRLGGEGLTEKEWENEGGGGWKVMPIHLDNSALHFPGNRWKQCIKAPRGNPRHPGIAEAWPGS